MPKKIEVDVALEKFLFNDFIVEEWKAVNAEDFMCANYHATTVPSSALCSIDSLPRFIHTFGNPESQTEWRFHPKKKRFHRRWCKYRQIDTWKDFVD